MRVLLMNHFPLQGSGSGVYTVNIARALVRKGHEVCIIMPENEVLAELDVDGIRLHPVYFDSCSTDALDFDFPCFTTHPRSVMTFYELDDAQVAASKSRFARPSKTRSRPSIPMSSTAGTSGCRQATRQITAYRSSLPRMAPTS